MEPMNRAGKRVVSLLLTAVLAIAFVALIGALDARFSGPVTTTVTTPATTPNAATDVRTLTSSP
jgi:hypothetical protein